MARDKQLERDRVNFTQYIEVEEGWGQKRVNILDYRSLSVEGLWSELKLLGGNKIDGVIYLPE